MLTSADFRARNNIVFEAPIISASAAPGQWPVTPTEFKDVVDLNHNNSVDYTLKTASGGGDAFATLFCNEPALGASYGSIKDLAGQLQKEVVTQDDMQDCGANFPYSRYSFDGYNGAYYGNGGQSVSSTETLGQLKDKILSDIQGGVGAKWAFDCNKNTFILYTPKAA